MAGKINAAHHIVFSQILPQTVADIRYTMAELGTRFFLRFALALSHSLAELFTLALSRPFLGLKFRAFAFALSRSLIFRALFSCS